MKPQKNDYEKYKFEIYLQFCAEENIRPNRGISIVKFLKYLKTSLVEELFFK